MVELLVSVYGIDAGQDHRVRTEDSVGPK